MSTRRWPAVQAFRMRVSMSATGSVMLMQASLSPAGLAHAGDVSPERELAEADPAESELPQHGAHPPAALATADPPGGEFRGALGALDPARLRHRYATFWGVSPRNGQPNSRSSPMARSSRRAAVGPCESLLTMSGNQNVCAAVYALTLAFNVALSFMLIPM